MKKVSFLSIALIMCVAFFSCSFHSKLNSNEPKILNNVRHQYDSTSQEHTFFWRFENKYEKPIAASATINITIINDKQEEVFNKDYQVTESDYGKWTSQNNPNDELLGRIVASDSEIEAGASENGKATITATFDKGHFEPVEIDVYDLPQKDVTVHLPELPAKCDYYGFDDELLSSVSVTDISWEYNNALKIKFTAQMSYQAYSVISYGYVAYELTDQDGEVVARNQIKFNDMNVGETVEQESYVVDIEPGDELTLSITDYR